MKRLLLGILFACSALAAPVTVEKKAEPPKPQTTKDWCIELAKELKSIKKESCSARPWEIDARSTGDRVIPRLFWPMKPEKMDKKEDSKDGQRILIVAAIHGDEIAAVSVAFRWMDFLERTKADSFVRKNKYLFVPLANPDGFFSSPRTRTNLNKVDLNRNFATDEWDKRALFYWKTKANSDPRRYPGPKAGSEKETQIIQKWIEEFKPDLIISVHAPYNVVDHDGPIEFPNMKSPLPVRALGAYPGSLGSYGGIERNIPVVTPELPDANHLPKTKALEDLFLFVLKAKY